MVQYYLDNNYNKLLNFKNNNIHDIIALKLSI